MRETFARGHLVTPIQGHDAVFAFAEQIVCTLKEVVPFRNLHLESLLVNLCLMQLREEFGEVDCPRNRDCC